jgi:hypothetical protein
MIPTKRGLALSVLAASLVISQIAAAADNFNRQDITALDEVRYERVISV